MKENIFFILLMSGFILNGCDFAQNHECRFWGIVFSDNNPKIELLIRSHLDSLRQLGTNNPDGWGIGYFVPSLTDTLLPVIRRGEPSAPIDPRYSESVSEVIRNVKKSAIGHVRKGSSGPVSGIPDPHPFRRKCINRKFDMLFAHNGSINEKILLQLISQINPSYLDQNPPDYSPDYLDSDLWAILIVEMLDTYPHLSVEECLKMAVIKLDSALALEKSQMNFVLSVGNTMWALNFTKAEPKAVTVYYFPDSLISSFWVVASQPLDGQTKDWVEIPNRTLVCLKPNEPVRFIPISQKFDTTKAREHRFFYHHPNPFDRLVTINYYVFVNNPVSINIYDVSGSLVKKLTEEYNIPGKHTVYWDGLDKHGIQLPSGVYFCHIKSPEEEKTLKLLLTR
ncbi:MAG: class II glutamine amidotransferase [bacterium]